MLTQKINQLLKGREFISVATCDFNGRPNAVPKFLLKAEDNFIYLVDYTIGRTWENLKVNPRVSLSLTDRDNLTGYQVNGSVQIVDSGPVYEEIVDELERRKISLSVERIIEGIHQEKTHDNFELVMHQKFVLFKVKIEEIVEVAPSGALKREKV
ncbi:MAG: pyridoxamine 5'-phosphate oxidase family protein [Candidatus Omnitrophica bacterium]|nr:pyridoxamine 5'-phosphate oxidase family protein [Candidatus Omnitrophota bacterium]